MLAMLYFAELYGKKVTSADGKTVGRLTDFAFLATDQPLITKLRIDTKVGHILVPISSMKAVNGTVMLSPGYETSGVADNELSVRIHLLDQQIIDLKGNKVVRVNDVVIQDKPYFVIAGVDVGMLGIARWLKLEQWLNRQISHFGTSLRSNFLPWENIQPIELSRGKVQLKREEAKLTKLAPEDLADHLERLSVKNLTKILDLLPNEYEAEVIQNLNVSRQRELLRNIQPKHAASILSLIDPDEAVDILLTLSERRRSVITPLLTEEARKRIDYLLSLSTTDIGSLATTDFFTADPEETATAVRRRMKRDTTLATPLTYVYVINKKKELVGVCNLHELLMADGETPMYKFMIPNVVAVYLTTPPEIAMKKMIKYKIYSLPIINDRRGLLGIVTIDDLVENMQEKLT